MHKNMLFGFAVILSVVASSHSAQASKQIVSCTNRVSLVLFGSQSAYGELFLSGYLNAPISEGVTQATVAPRARPDEQAQPGAVYAGSNYNGDGFAIEIPKEYLGKNSPQPFYASALIRLRGRQENTPPIVVKCMSTLSDE